MLNWSDTVSAFDEAAQWFGQVVLAAHGNWDKQALGEWTVRDLVGHASRALLTVEFYLGKPATTVEVISAFDYFRLALSSIGDPVAVAQRGRDAGAALGDDPVEAVTALIERVTTLVRNATPEDLVGTPVGGMWLVDYLPTRTFELTVHTCDLAVALGQKTEIPDMAATESVSLVGGLAVRAGHAAPLLLAATGRSVLPRGFTVL